MPQKMCVLGDDRPALKHFHTVEKLGDTDASYTFQRRLAQYPFHILLFDRKMTELAPLLSQTSYKKQYPFHRKKQVNDRFKSQDLTIGNFPFSEQHPDPRNYPN